jgi:hypothetical protein
MNKLNIFVIFALLSCAGVNAFTYKIYNRTRSKISVKLNMIAFPDKDVVIEPESSEEVVIGGSKVPVAIRSLEITGMNEPLSSLDTKVYEVPGNKLSPRISFYIAHKDPKYVNGKVIVSGGNPRLAIYPGSGEIVVERR